MILETCRRGAHVNRIEMRVEMDRFGNKRLDEWHVCRMCRHERRHATRRVIAQDEATRRSVL